MHDKEFVRAISGSEGSLPFVAISYTDKVVRTMKVNFGEDTSRMEAI
jgi:hypothetical protein